MSATHDPTLRARKRAIDDERKATLGKLRGEAREITDKLRDQTLRKNLIIRLRSNIKPKLHELAPLVGLTGVELDAIETEAKASAVEAKAENPAWHPHHPSRPWTLAELVGRFRKNGKI